MPDTQPAEPVVDVAGLTKRFGDLTVVDDLDLRVNAGEVHALLGPNGSGKTTTVRMLTALLPPDAGQARVCGHDLIREAPMSAAPSAWSASSPRSTGASPACRT